MVPDEMTVTVIQGRGTALYTPLEQYGGDAGHTDARSDIYAFGATLYHLLTSTPPVEAKQRFLRPDALPLPSEINSEIDPSVESSILWAMALHPDERPQSVEVFRQSLFASLPLDGAISISPPFPLNKYLRAPIDLILAVSVIILFLTATIATLF